MIYIYKEKYILRYIGTCAVVYDVKDIIARKNSHAFCRFPRWQQLVYVTSLAINKRYAAHVVQRIDNN